MKANLGLEWVNQHLKCLSIKCEVLSLVSSIYVKLMEAAVHSYKPSTEDVKTGGYLGIIAQPGQSN